MMRRQSKGIASTALVALLLAGCITSNPDGSVVRPDPQVLAIAETCLQLAVTAYIEYSTRQDAEPQERDRLLAAVHRWRDIVQRIRDYYEERAPPEDIEAR